MTFHKTALLGHVLVFCICALVTCGQGSWRNFDKLRRSNCTKCTERLKINIGDVLPRLTLIKHKILNAIGKTSAQSLPPTNRNIHRTDIVQPVDIATPRPEPRLGYRINEIVSHSRTQNGAPGEVLLKFSFHGNDANAGAEAMGASLMLFVDRKRKIKSGGRGKKIFLEVSKLVNGTWDQLTFLRTKVKRRRWKRMGLPLTVAQQLLDSGSLDLKITCVGCGRLVEIVLSKRHKRSHKHSTKVRTRRKLVATTKEPSNRHRGSPLLVISTRVPV